MDDETKKAMGRLTHAIKNAKYGVVATPELFGYSFTFQFGCTVVVAKNLIDKVRRSAGLN